jgi:hypothetical protein
MLANEKKVAVILCNIKRMTADPEKMYTFSEPVFDADKVF